MSRGDGGPAFPMPIAGCNDGGVYNTMQQSGGEYGGMTLRDYFAAKVIQGISSVTGVDFGGPDEVARIAYKMADAMLAARKEETR